MRIVSWTILVALNLGSIVLAQTSVQYPVQTTSGTGFTGAPYSGKETTVNVKTASDGTKYTNTYVTYLWRDADGRTRQEHVEEIPSGKEFRSVIINDPVGGVYLKWSLRDDLPNKIVTIWAAPGSRRPASAPSAVTTPSSPAQTSCGPNCKQETLTPQSINGVYAEGTRTTRTVHAGKTEDGKDLSLTVTNELWVAPDLKIIVRHISDDPRTGISRTEVTDIVRGNPDPALFQIPEGYLLKDMRRSLPIQR